MRRRPLAPRAARRARQWLAGRGDPSGLALTLPFTCGPVSPSRLGASGLKALPIGAPPLWRSLRSRSPQGPRGRAPAPLRLTLRSGAPPPPGASRPEPEFRRPPRACRGRRDPAIGVHDRERRHKGLSTRKLPLPVPGNVGGTRLPGERDPSVGHPDHVGSLRVALGSHRGKPHRPGLQLIQEARHDRARSGGNGSSGSPIALLAQSGPIIPIRHRAPSQDSAERYAAGDRAGSHVRAGRRGGRGPWPRSCRGRPGRLPGPARGSPRLGPGPGGASGGA